MDPFTRDPLTREYVYYNTASSFTETINANACKTGVTSHTDTANVSLAVCGDASCTGTFWANVLRSTSPSFVSDGRIKLNKKIIYDPLKLLKGVRCYRYRKVIPNDFTIFQKDEARALDYMDSKLEPLLQYEQIPYSEECEIGAIAQDLESNCERYLHNKGVSCIDVDTTGVKMVKTNSLLGILVGAVNQLNDQIIFTQVLAVTATLLAGISLSVNIYNMWN